ncbi:MAG: DUF2073 domain-containing protein [Candidatus Pacearchaeota archaeon]
MKTKKKEKKENLKSIKELSIHLLPYHEIKNLNSTERIKKILGIILSNNILIIQGKLKPEEETRLIEDTMAMIDHVPGFKGVELAVISGEGNESFFGKFKGNLINALAGGDLRAITIIGPATIVREIKRDPKKIELLLNKH